jgi:hypothetical protein
MDRTVVDLNVNKIFTDVELLYKYAYQALYASQSPVLDTKMTNKLVMIIEKLNDIKTVTRDTLRMIEDAK